MVARAVLNNNVIEIHPHMFRRLACICVCPALSRDRHPSNSKMTELEFELLLCGVR